MKLPITEKAFREAVELLRAVYTKGEVATLYASELHKPLEEAVHHCAWYVGQGTSLGVGDAIDKVIRDNSYTFFGECDEYHE